MNKKTEEALEKVKAASIRARQANVIKTAAEEQLVNATRVLLSAQEELRIADSELRGAIYEETNDG